MYDAHHVLAIKKRPIGNLLPTHSDSSKTGSANSPGKSHIPAKIRRETVEDGFEYLLQVPANRIGFTRFTLPQLKILQEVITLAVFVPFAVLYMQQPVRWNFLWAGLCLLGAVFFIFRG